MDRKLFFDTAGSLRIRVGKGAGMLVPFPVCLAIRHGDNLQNDCPNFILDIDKSRVFVRTDTPLPEGSFVEMHFYIPPEDKLLASVKGWVLGAGRDGDSARGMLIKFTIFSRMQLRGLAHYAEGKKHLVDKTA